MPPLPPQTHVFASPAAPWQVRFIQGSPGAVRVNGALKGTGCQGAESPTVSVEVWGRWHESTKYACGRVSAIETVTYTKRPWDGPGDPPEAWEEAPAEKSLTTTITPADGESGATSDRYDEWSDGTASPGVGCTLNWDIVETKEPPEPDWSEGSAAYDVETEYEETGDYQAAQPSGPDWRGPYYEEEFVGDSGDGFGLAQAVHGGISMSGENEWVYSRSARHWQGYLRIDLSHKEADWPDGVTLRGRVAWYLEHETYEGAVSRGETVSARVTLTAANPTWQSELIELVAEPRGEEPGINLARAVLAAQWLPVLPF